jgi:dTDP-4-amino-4,6-dideoxygalactose transaminase
MNPAALPSLPIDLFLRALTAEGIPGVGSYPCPIYANPVFGTWKYRRGECPEAERFCRECFWVSHEILLAEEADLDDFIRAVEKIRDAAEELATAAGERNAS